MSYDNDQLRRIVEGAILAAGEALSIDRLHGLFEEHEAPEKGEIKAILEAIAADCDGRGFQLVEVASGWRFQVREDIATWVNRLWEEKPQKYSRAMLETLALIAYRQPLTRGDIEDVRGVAVSSQIIKTLVEREWVKVVGHRDVPGRPSLYATTRHFLDYFNLKSLDELPTLSELKDIDSINGSLDLDNDYDASEAPEATPDGSEVFDPEEERDIDDAVTGDTLVEDSDAQLAVEAVGLPFELDEEAAQPHGNDEAVAEPTVEQDEYAQAHQDLDESQDWQVPDEDVDDLGEDADNSGFTDSRDHNSDNDYSDLESDLQSDNQER